METTNQAAEFTVEDVRREAAMETTKAAVGQRMQLIIFRLGSEEYGMPIDQIKEVVLTPRVARIPQTPPHIKGVANIRGNIIAIMDLGLKFGLASAQAEEESAGHYSLVLASEKFKVGILVREVPNTLAINTADIDSSSNFIQYTSLDNNCITGVVKAGKRMIILLDMLKMMENENFNTISKAIQ
jgi:purine-binding chemotaxis protein CheW